MSRPISICMLLHRSLEHDARVRREALALQGAGHRVAILELGPTGHLPEFDRRAVRARPIADTRGILQRWRQALAMLAFLAMIVRLRSRVVHAHDVAMLLPGLAGARLTGASLVYDTHELASGVAYRQGLLARAVTGIERFGIRRADLVLTVSDSIADRLQTSYGLADRPVVLRNFCALRRPDQDSASGGLRETLGIDSQPLVLHQGAAAPQRGCENLIRAIAQIPDAHLAFLGPIERDFDLRLTAAVNEAGIASRVHFVPSVPLDELLAHTSEADLGVTLFESTSESYRLTIPNKLFEYVAAGVPVVGSNQPEVERLIAEHGLGWTVDPANPDAVAAALRRGLAESRDAALRERLRRADGQFSWADEAQRLIHAYRALDA